MLPILLAYGILATLAARKTRTCFHWALSQVGFHKKNILSIVFGSRASSIMRRKLKIAWTDVTFSLLYVTKTVSFPIASLLFHFTSKLLIPVAIFGLVASRPTLSDTYAYNHVQHSLQSNSGPAALFGLSRCMFSLLNSVNAHDPNRFEFNHNFAFKNQAMQSAFRHLHPIFIHFPSIFDLRMHSMHFYDKIYAISLFPICVSRIAQRYEPRRCAISRKLSSQ